MKISTLPSLLVGGMLLLGASCQPISIHRAGPPEIKLSAAVSKVEDNSFEAGDQIGVYMEYPEFSKYQKVVDPKTLVNGYQDEEGNIFYVEPAFYYNLHGFKDKRAEAYEPILAKMEEIVKQFHHVVFTGNFEAPMYEKEGYIYKEIEDISDALGFFFEDKSRGSDYGD